jgi:AcrR family transcriptional regulator
MDKKKPPRRTKERILGTALEMFNTHGAPQVTTNALADELNISPGNLYYHFRNKDDIINQLFAQFESHIDGLLTLPEERLPNVEDAWLFLHLLFEKIWAYRFLYRDLNDLLPTNRKLELKFQSVLRRKGELARGLTGALARADEISATEVEREALCNNMVVIATYWLSFEYAKNPRQFNDPAIASAALARGAYHVLALVAPFMKPASRAHLNELAKSYL